MLQQTGAAPQTYGYVKDILLPISGVVVSLVAAFLVREFNKRALMQKQQEEERKAIYEKLNSFYGPLQRLRGKSKMLSEIFKEADYFKGKTGDDRRTLIILLRGHEFTGNDLELLEEIIRLGEKSETLIMKKSGLVADQSLRKVLDKASTHYTLIRLAKQKKLTQDVERFKGFVFPDEIDELLENDINKLNKRLNELNTRIELDWFSRRWLKILKKIKKEKADEQSRASSQSDNTLESVRADISLARLKIEDAQINLGHSRQAENEIEAACAIIDYAEQRLNKLSKQTEIH